jgi:hypothetical protein
VDAAVQIGADDDTISGGPGMDTTEEWKAYAVLPGDVIGIGKGHSREEALLDALQHAGVRT